MKIARFLYNQNIYIGKIEEDKVYIFENVASIVDVEEPQIIAEAIDFNDVKILAPLEKAQDIICLGLNYYEHALESANFKKEIFENKQTDAVYFFKKANRFLGPNEEINGHFEIVDSLDYEVELAFIINKEAYQVPLNKALDYVLGYTILNDVSARNIQTKHKEWFLGKSLDDFCPLGPWIVTKDEITNLNLGIRSYVNGELRQNSNTDKMIFDIPYIIHELTKGMTLYPGTVISTGTPSGVGMGFNPPKFLKKGDTIVCEIEKIGKLINIIK